MVILQAYYCTVKWLTLLFLFSRSQVWYLNQHSWHARAWTKPKIKDQWGIWYSSGHIWQFCHITFHLCLFTSFASSSCGLLLLQRHTQYDLLAFVRSMCVLCFYHLLSPVHHLLLDHLVIFQNHCTWERVSNS